VEYLGPRNPAFREVVLAQLSSSPARTPSPKGPLVNEQREAESDADVGASGDTSRGLALLVAGVFFMEILDGTVIAPAAPYIAADFGVTAIAINIAITAYLITLAVLIPISGWLTDLFGPRRVFMTAIAVFTVASCGCAGAMNLPMLTVTRVLQGVGGAMMVPVGRLVVLRTTDKSDLVNAIAYLTWPALVAPVVAPILGGVLSTYVSWRWIFIINLPTGLVALLLSHRLVPDLRTAVVGHLDWRGFALTATGVTALIVGIENIGKPSPAWAAGGVCIAVASVTLTAVMVYFVRIAQPLLDLRFLRTPTFRVTAVGGSVFGAVISAIPFLLALFFQLCFGWTAARAGLALTALFLGNVAIKPTTTPLMHRLGIRTVMLAALAASAACLIGIAFIQPTTPLPQVLGLLVLSGVFRSIGFTTYNSVAFADIEPNLMTPANTLMSMVQAVGTGLGVAIGALLVGLGGSLTGLLPIGHDTDGAYRFAFIILAAILVLPAVEGLILPRTAGDAVTGRS
jgi:EmrB/QacA subfamily drug resistance transporter